jgi:hypothetical protein
MVSRVQKNGNLDKLTRHLPLEPAILSIPSAPDMEELEEAAKMMVELQYQRPIDHMELAKKPNQSGLPCNPIDAKSLKVDNKTAVQNSTDVQMDDNDTTWTDLNLNKRVRPEGAGVVNNKAPRLEAAVSDNDSSSSPADAASPGVNGRDCSSSSNQVLRAESTEASSSWIRGSSPDEATNPLGPLGGRRCQHQDCSKLAKGRTLLCIAHGGGKRYGPFHNILSLSVKPHVRSHFRSFACGLRVVVWLTVRVRLGHITTILKLGRST